MHARAIRVILILAILAGGSSATLLAQDAAVVSDGDACVVLLSYLSDGFVRGKAVLAQSYYPGPEIKYIAGGDPTPSGIRFQLKDKRNQELTLEYKDFSSVELEKESPNSIHFNPRVPTTEKGLSIVFGGRWHPRQDAADYHLVQALNKFMTDAHAGHPYDCHIVTPAMAAATSAKDLADFQQKAAAWQAMNPKPPVSDEVTKKRLLAEDAVQEKNLAAAEEYYRDGIAIDPTWAPGWYNAALISAELKDYAAAALDMKHYLILLPDASDAAAAKERVLLWEAKAEESNRN